jgi:hypothetical protein
MAIGSIGQRILVKVVNKLGGLEKASLELDIPSRILMRFIEGKVSVPDAILLRAMDHVLDETSARVPPATPFSERAKPVN